MNTSLRSQLLATTGGLVLILASSFFLMFSVWLPKMTLARDTIRRNEAAVTAIQRQQENVSELTQQLATRQAEKERLEKELWTFSHEDAFFDLWDTFSNATQTTVTLNSVADAAPGPIPVQREASLTLKGSLTNITKTLQAFAALTPAVVLREVHFAADSSSPGITTAQVTVSTLWYDNSLR